MRHAAFLAVEPVPFVPEVTLHQADDLQALWEAVGTEAPPYWAFAWLGGQAVARHVLDNPGLVRRKRVLDLATGSGLVGLAASIAGAEHVLAADIDPLSGEAVRANAEANGIAPSRLTWTSADLLDGPAPDVDVLLAGDVLYEKEMAVRVLSWLAAFPGLVLLGDPGRDYLPREGLMPVAEYEIPTTRELEGATSRRTKVFCL